MSIDEVGKRKVGDWIQTRSGIRFYLLDPKPGDFVIQDIAHALSNMCRFAGHTREFYSVAQHSVLVAELVREKLKHTLYAHRVDEIVYAALMHDASDAYMLDMPRPFKYLPEFAWYKETESRLMEKMAWDMGFIYPKPYIVDEADNILLATEARDSFDQVIDSWHLKYGALLPRRIRPWSPRKAEREFLRMFYRVNQMGSTRPSLFSKLFRKVA